MNCEERNKALKRLAEADLGEMISVLKLLNIEAKEEITAFEEYMDAKAKHIIYGGFVDGEVYAKMQDAISKVFKKVGNSIRL